MRRFWIILIGGIAAGLLTYAVYFRAATGSLPPVAGGDARTDLGWLKAEYGVAEPEFDKIVQLHEAYRSKCDAVCARIAANSKELGELLHASSEVTDRIQELMEQSARLRLECETNMLRHFLSVSACMPPEQGRRYLDWATSRTLLAHRHMMEASQGGHVHHATHE